MEADPCLTAGRLYRFLFPVPTLRGSVGQFLAGKWGREARRYSDFLFMVIG